MVCLCGTFSSLLSHKPNTCTYTLRTSRVRMSACFVWSLQTSKKKTFYLRHHDKADSSSIRRFSPVPLFSTSSSPFRRGKTRERKKEASFFSGDLPRRNMQQAGGVMVKAPYKLQTTTDPLRNKRDFEHRRRLVGRQRRSEQVGVKNHDMK